MLGTRALEGAPDERSGGRRRRPVPPWLTLSLTLTLAALLVAGSVLSYVGSLRAARVIPGLRLQAHAVGALGYDELDPLVQRIAADYLRQPIALRVGRHQLAVSRRQLGARVDVGATVERLKQLGKSGDLLLDVADRLRARQGKLDVPLATTVHRRTAREFLLQLKGRVDRPAVASRIDLERGEVIAASDGYRLHLHDALAAAEVALRQGSASFELPVAVTRGPGDQRHRDLVIKHVLAEFSTVYSQADKDKDRAFNLKVAASKLDGVILRPGEELSFNKRVGPRTQAEGYRTAPVISQGELVDGMAGGACQLSSTLFAAAFFAGLDLLSSRPHTMPSSYIKMGLDAAVAYPTTDLVIRNPHDFPVAIHYQVSQGRVTVRIRGKQRPWRKVTLNRRLLETTPFKEIVRDDPSIPRGARVVAQLGVPGFVFERERVLYGQADKAARSETRKITYPPTTQIVRRGTGKPDATWKAPEPRKPYGAVPELYSLSQ